MRCGHCTAAASANAPMPRSLAGFLSAHSRCSASVVAPRWARTFTEALDAFVAGGTPACG